MKIKVMSPLSSPSDSSGSSQGLAELDKAIAVLGQINILFPIAYGLGKSLVGIIQSATKNADAATKQQALDAIEEFRAVSADVRQTAETWLDTHPRTS